MGKRLSFIVIFLFYCKLATAQLFEWADTKQQCSRDYYLNNLIVDYNNNLISIGGGLCCQVCPIQFIEKTNSSGSVEFWKEVDGWTSNGTAAGVYIASTGIDLQNNIYLMLSISPSESSYSIDGTTVYNPLYPNSTTDWGVLVKLNTNGSLVWAKATGGRSFGFEVSDSGFLFCSNGSIYNSNGIQITSGTLPHGRVRYKSGHWIYWNNDVLLRLSPTNGQVISSFNLPSNTDNCQLDSNGDVYSVSPLGISKYNLANSLVWSVNPGSVYSISLATQTIWITTFGFSPEDCSLAKISKLNGSLIQSDTLLSSPNAIVEAINDQSVYVGSNNYSEDSFHVIWKPYVLTRSKMTGSYSLGKYSSATPGNVINFAQPFWSDAQDIWPWGWLSSENQCNSFTFYINYQLYSGSFGTGAVVRAELSDATGTFSNPIVIGTDTPTSNTGSIACQIPQNIMGGNYYKIRLGCSNPVIISPQESGNLRIITQLKPVITTSGPLDICEGSSVVLTVSNTDPSIPFSWSTSETTASILVTSAGSYYVSNYNSFCGSSSDTVTINTYPPSTDSIAISGLTQVINGQSYTYSVTPVASATDYNWSSSCGTVVSGQGTNTVTVYWPNPGNCTLDVVVTKNYCPNSTNLQVEIEPGCGLPIFESINHVSCHGTNTGAINLNISGEYGNPGLLISEIRTDPPLGDSNYEWVELIATDFIDFTETPYTVVFTNNGNATSNGWVEGQIPSPPPRNSTYAFLINSGSIKPGDVVYVGGSLMEPTGTKLRVKNTATENGDGGIGGAFSGASGVLGNGGIADGVAVFNLPISQINSNIVPVDAIFFGTGIGAAALSDISQGFTLPMNDRYFGGRLMSSSYFVPYSTGIYSIKASGQFNRANGAYSIIRTWSTNSTPWSSAQSDISVIGNSYLWSNGATTKNISGLAAGTYSISVTTHWGCVAVRTYIISQPQELTTTLTSIPASCFANSDGSILAEVSGGTMPYTYLWSNGSFTSNLTNQSAGIYTVTIHDAEGCSTVLSEAITEPDFVNISSISPPGNSSGFPVTLYGGNLSDITNISFGGADAATFTILDYTSLQVVVPPGAQSGPITVIDANGCITESTVDFNYIAVDPELTIRIFNDGYYMGNGYMDLPLVNSGLSLNGQHTDFIDISFVAPYELFGPQYETRTILLASGHAVISFPGWMMGESFYIVVKHRNSIETWSKDLVLLQENTYFNFSGVAQFPALGPISINDVASTMVECNGQILNDGGSPVTIRGFCWSTSPKPTVALNTKTTNGSGIGVLVSSLTNLIPSTKYYVRAYATNSTGTAYSNEVSFTTDDAVFDINGNIYDTLIIGTQVWLKQNLKVTTYLNGDPISTNLTNTQWQTTTNGAYTIYNNSSVSDSIYGKLYNWYAVADPRGLCPSGWHIPTDADWKVIESHIGMSAGELNLMGGRGNLQSIGGKMKTTGILGHGGLWTSPNTGASNSTAFSILPAGIYTSNSIFYFINEYSCLWTSTPVNSTQAYYRGFGYNYKHVDRQVDLKNSGFSVRCLKD